MSAKVDAGAIVATDMLRDAMQARRVADQLRPKVPKLAALMDAAEPDVLAYKGLPAQPCVKLHSINPLKCLDGVIKRRTEVAGIFPNEAAMAPPTMLPTLPGGRCWLETACERSMERGSAPAQ